MDLSNTIKCSIFLQKCVCECAYTYTESDFSMALKILLLKHITCTGRLFQTPLHSGAVVWE